MEHIYQNGSNNDSYTFVLLHGTGGDERNMLPIAEVFDKTFNVLSVRGSVNEKGALRFFRRKAEGVYDVEDLHQRGNELQTFIIKASEEYQFDIGKVILLGFSNGSNIAINLLLKENNPFKYAMLLAPMYPLELEEKHDLSSLHVFLSMGENDPIVNIEDSKHVIQLFETQDAVVTTSWTNSHEISQTTINDGIKWLQTTLNNK